jgi:hypothetical protein
MKKKIIILFILAFMTRKNVYSQYCPSVNICNLICNGSFEEVVYDGLFGIAQGGSVNGASNDSIWRYFTLDPKEYNTIDLFRVFGDSVTYYSDTSSNPKTTQYGECGFNTRALSPPPNGGKIFTGMVSDYRPIDSYGNRETLVFSLHKPLIIGANYNLSFLARKCTQLCSKYTVLIYGSNLRPSSRPITTKLDGSISSTGFQAILIDSVLVDSATWKTYTKNFNASSTFSYIFIGIRDTGYTSSQFGEKHGYFDKFELTRANQKTLTIKAQDSIRLCSNNASITYVIKSTIAQTTPVNLKLIFPTGVTRSAGSDFNALGAYTILANKLNNGDSIVLKFNFTVDSTIDSGKYYHILLDALTAGFCISETSNFDTKFLRGGNVAFNINATLLHPNCLDFGKIIPNPIASKAPYTYKWSSNFIGNTNVSTNKDNIEIRAGWIYDLTVTDNYGCTVSQRYILPQDTPTKLDAYVSARLDCNTNTGILKAIPIDGTGTYTYLWDNGSTNPVRNITNLNTLYYVTVTEVPTGCKYKIVENTNLNSYQGLGSGIWLSQYPLFTSTYKGKIRVLGQVWVDNTFDLRYTDIVLYPGAEIIFYSGIGGTYAQIDSVNIYQNNIYTCGNELAKGLNFEYVKHYTKINIEKNEIGDCYKAINFKIWDGGSNQNMIKVISNIFENNAIGLHIKSSASNLEIYGNIFKGVASIPNYSYLRLKNPYSSMTADVTSPASLKIPSMYTTTGITTATNKAPWAGIIAENITNLVIGNTSKPKNQFIDLNNGVMLYGGNTNITNCQFETGWDVMSSIKNYGINPAVIANTAVYALYNKAAMQGRLTFIGLGITPTSPYTMNGVSKGLHADGYYIENFTNAKINAAYNYGVLIKTHSIEGIAKKYNITNNIIYNIAEMDMSPIGIGIYDYSIDKLNVSILNNKIYNTSRGIVASKLTKLASTTSIAIKNNVIEGLPRRLNAGIEVMNYPNISKTPYVGVTNNNIKFMTPTTWINDDLAGIQYTNNTNILDKENTITALAPSVQSISYSPRVFPIGIHYENSTGTFTCNTVNNIYTGVRFFADCENSDWTKNKILNHHTGLRLGTNTFLKTQTRAGNTFKGFCTQEARTDQVKWTTFYYSNLNGDYNPSTASPNPSFWWRPTSPAAFGVETDYCGLSPNIPIGLVGISIGTKGDIMVDNNRGGFTPLGLGYAPIEAVELTVVDTSILTNTAIFNSFIPEQTWQYRQELYNKLKPVENEFRDSSIFRDYIQYIEDGTINEFTEINYIERTISEVNNDRALAIDNLQSEIVSLWSEMRTIDSSIFVSTDSTELAALKSTKLATLAAIEQKNQAIYTLSEISHDATAIRLDSIIAINDSIVPEGVSDSLLRRFNQVYYQTYARGISELLPMQYATYEALANQCPFKHLDVVYRSRGVVRSYHDTVKYADSILCAQIGITLKSSKPIPYAPLSPKTISYKVYPNPTIDFINIQISEIPKTPIQFIITDILGRELYNQIIELSSNTYSIDTKQWQNGIYHLRLINGKTTVYQTPVQIIR